MRLAVKLPPIAILAGGQAKRLGFLALHVPKVMVPVAGEPFAAHQLRRLKEAGFTEVIYCLGHHGEQVKDYVRDGENFGLAVRYSEETEPLGTGGAIKNALRFLGDEFFVTYGDTLLDFDYGDLVKFLHAARSASGIMTVMKNENKLGASNVKFERGRIVSHDKRNPTKDMKHIDYGCSLLKSTAFSPRFLDVNTASFDLNDLYSTLVNKGQMLGYEVQNRFWEIGTPEALKETEEMLAKLTENSNV